MATTSLVGHVEIIPAQAPHHAWLVSTFRHQVAWIAGTSKSQARNAGDALRRVLTLGCGRAVVCVPRHHEELLGWAVALDGALVFAFVREPLRRQGIGAALATAITDHAPVDLAYWTDTADAIERHGYPIRYNIRAYRAFCRYMRRTHEPHEELTV